MNIVNDILVNTLFPDTDFVQTLSMNSVVPKYVENQEKGNPSVCKNCAEAPFKDLHIYGRSEQMTTTGAQLLDIPDTERTIRGVTLRIQNGVIEMNGTATENGYAYVDIAKTPLTGTYTLSIDGAVKGALLDDKFQRLIESTRSLNGETACMLTFYITKDVKYSLTGIKVMLNAGGTPLPWEPYTGGKPSPSPDYPQEIVSAGDDGNLSVIVKNPDNEQMQSVSFSTPNGLPGIPVTSGGNYTDENGQQWICDEVDLGRGVYVQRVDKGVFDATKALTEQSVILATPIENPITAAEIAAYKSLRTYRGTTIVEARDKAGISVKYNMPMPKLSKNGALRRWFKRHPII